jgi:hypothetical protein
MRFATSYRLTDRAKEPYVGDIGAKGTYIGPGIQPFKRNNSGKRASRLLEELQPILRLTCGVEFPAEQSHCFSRLVKAI